MKLLNIFRMSAVIGIVLVASILLVDRWLSAQASSRIFDSTAEIPPRSIGLVLGTSKYIAKSLNPYYQYRMDAAISLYEQKKVNVLLLSGDNAHRSYNEPWTMKRDLLKAGVPDDNIVLDYAGFRTLDSVVRAKRVFDADHFVIITQRFHCERALFIADRNNIDAICLAVPGPKGFAGLKIRMREVLARIKAIMDIYILDMKPKFLGPKEPITPPEADQPDTEQSNSDQSKTEQTNTKPSDTE